MQGNFFMQLILILALLLFGGSSSKNSTKSGIAELFEPETVELIKEISGGGEQIDEFMKEVEHISELVSVFAPLMQSAGQAAGQDNASTAHNSGGDIEESFSPHTAPDISYILKPVRNIADDGIYNALASAV